MPSKRQHYVPIFYLNHFVDRDGERLVVYDKETGRHSRQTPNNTGVEGHIYTALDPSGQPTDLMETGFLQKVDDFGRPLLDKIRNSEPFGPGDGEALALFVAVMHSRVPRQIQVGTEVAEAVAEHTIRTMVDPEDMAAKTGRTVEETRKILADPLKYFRIRGDRKSAMLNSIDRCWGFARHLMLLDVAFIRTDKPVFITCDAPVVVTVNEGRQERLAGWAEPRVQIVFVIDPKTCVYYWAPGAVSPTSWRQINQRIAWTAERYIYASKRSKETLALVRQTRGTRQLPKIDKTEAFRMMDERDARMRLQKQKRDE